MCRFVKETYATEFIIGTENGLLHKLSKDNPDKKFYPVAENAICENMKKINLGKVLNTLREMKYEVKVPEEIACRAKKCLNRMIAIKEGTSAKI